MFRRQLITLKLKFSIDGARTLCNDTLPFKKHTLTSSRQKQQNLERFTNLRVILAQGPC